MQIIDSTPAALSANLQMYLRNGDVFFDIETTGLSWRTSHLYLIGALFFDPAADTFTLRQWFLDRPTEEKEMLVSFFTFLSDVKRLVHFNGTTFDLPYLTHKALFYQMEDPLSSVASLDLYQALRPFQSILGLSSMKQKNVEQYLSFPRKDQLNGKQLILVYHDYLQTLDEKKLELLFLHNYEDVLGMGSVLELLALPALFHGDFSVQSCRFTGQTLEVSLQPEREVPVFLSRVCADGSLTAFGSRVSLSLQTHTAELKYFFPDYKNYYYLPLEDQAVHKSVGAFVDPEHRQKAKAANCYQRRTGTFLPQQKEFFTPAFREDFKSRPYYFEWSDAFLSQEDLLKEYLCSELQLFFKDDSKTRK